MAASTSPNFGDYSWMKDASSREICMDAHKVISDLGLWDWMKTATPPADKGFSYWYPRPAELEKLDAALTSGHSGCSYGWTMRQMEFIAKHSWDSYVLKMKASGV
jgi:hypothetical protein